MSEHGKVCRWCGAETGSLQKTCRRPQCVWKTTLFRSPIDTTAVVVHRQDPLLLDAIEPEAEPIDPKAVLVVIDSFGKAPRRDG